MRKYFEYVPTGLSVAVNLLLGLGASMTTLLALLFLQCDDPDKNMYVTLMFGGTILVVCVVNFILYFICKKVRKNPPETMSKEEARSNFRIVIFIFIIMLFWFFV